MKTNLSLAVSDESISAFWRWFLANYRGVETMLDRDETEELSHQINAQINQLSSQLAWEIGPGIVKPFMFVFPIAGDRERKTVVEKILAKAPTLERWEFHASRPARSFQPEVQLPDQGLCFRSADWRFTIKPSSISDRFDLQVFDDRLATFDEKTALTAVFILIDAVLGEDMVERWIDGIRILPMSANPNSLPMPIIAQRLAELVPS